MFLKRAQLPQYDLSCAREGGMGSTIFLQGFFYTMTASAAWCIMALLAVCAVYLVARELVAIAWLGELLSDTALGIMQWTLLGFASFLPVVILAAFIVDWALSSYWNYYYPWLVLHG